MVIVLPSFEIANDLFYAIAATPNDDVFVWFDPDDIGYDSFDPETGDPVHHPPINKISVSIAIDEHVAIEHMWSQDDNEWLQEYLSEENGVEFFESLPEDWDSEN